jgi:hypothetical protein
LLSGPQIAPPEFPADILGDYWSAWCRTAAKAANAPVDYVATSSLVVAGALIGNARTIAASPDWHENPNLWAALIGVPSSGKSPALDPVSRSLERFEKEAAGDFVGVNRQHLADVESARIRKEMWQTQVKNAAKEGVEPPALPADADEPSAPVRPRVRLSDTTLEAAADLSAGNPKGLVLVRDELAGWIKGMNRYGGDGERQFWLQAYGARPYVVDRKKSPLPVTINRLAISVVGGIQPQVLSDVMSGEEDGFAARFIYCYPDPVPGFSLASEPVDHDGAFNALGRLRSLALVDDGENSLRPFVCKLDPDAASEFEVWWRERRREASESSGLWAGWLGKQGGTALRLALILEHLWWSAPSANSANSANSFPHTVTLSAMNAAMHLIDRWAGPMAKRAFGAAAASPAEADAAALATWIRRRGLNTFNTRAARRSADGPGGRLVAPTAMSAACELLEEAGLIRRSGGRAGDTPGRARNDYSVNPIILEDRR